MAEFDCLMKWVISYDGLLGQKTAQAMLTSVLAQWTIKILSALTSSHKNVIEQQMFSCSHPILVMYGFQLWTISGKLTHGFKEAVMSKARTPFTSITWCYACLERLFWGQT